MPRPPRHEARDGRDHTLQKVDVGSKPLEPYADIVGRDFVDELRDLARALRGARVAHVNATSYGGGVSELLRSIVPLYRALDIEADWLVIPGHQDFFDITKGIHNALQGADVDWTEDAKANYLRHNESVAELLTDPYDYVVVHDPQPAPLRHFRGRDRARWIWRCHLDTSEPNREVLGFLLPFLEEYDAWVFTLDAFVPPELRDRRYVTIPPGIDPLSPKNMAMPLDLSRHILSWAGVLLDRPLITQISRFDPWKDPIGVIEVYRRVREQKPGTQLALLGQMALDDPEGWEMYREILDEAHGDLDIHVLTNFTGIGNTEVNAFQCCSDVVLQKSIREGFGLVVSETLWKGTPMVAGRAGGIPLQMPEGVGGYLVDGIDAAAERTLELLRHPAEAKRLGAAGREHVRQNFLITRLLADELRLLASLA